MTTDNPYCLAKIKTHYTFLSDKEKIVADFVLENPKEIIHTTINEMAEDLKIAESTIFRFCKKIGFKGFQAFKIALAADIVTPITDIHENIKEEDDYRTITEKVFRSNIKTLEDTLQVFHGEAFHQTVQSVTEANRVEFFGVGGSAIIAMDAYHKFIRTGIPVNANLDIHIQLMSASQLKENDLAIFISHSGSTNDTLELLKVVKANGVKTIGITSYMKSPLSQAVDIPLYTVSEETEYRAEALSSRYAQLSILDAIYVNVMLARKDKGKESLQKIRKVISIQKI
ncbi:MurR/RpiR family transcriptional regulator [Caldibacillus lycopersici]|uniref:MurR/RpiR family transcriptional regulator n=1 Tax=Perspicuibacillus lycopersici TaxID=1325689 RepID=A0AAE3IUV7_9BACI|nr:MurR/RpiR family transcriptional regulator [Perspicuibacillus lycopersici]MCU9615023.1 MurR/RpiR family transcriptional regulator [Perspicuibacillus lycopersici]